MCSITNTVQAADSSGCGRTVFLPIVRHSCGTGRFFENRCPLDVKYPVFRKIAFIVFLHKSNRNPCNMCIPPGAAAHLSGNFSKFPYSLAGNKAISPVEEYSPNTASNKISGLVLNSPRIPAARSFKPEITARRFKLITIMVA